MKLTNELFPAALTLAVFSIVKLTLTTSISALEDFTVAFSLQYTSTMLVQLPTFIPCAVTVNSIDFPASNKSI